MNNPKRIFLIDGIGAVFSSLLLGVILPLFHVEIGMPKNSLYFLSLFPVLYCFFSFGCYSKTKSIKKYHLYIIGSLNLIYCLISVFKVAEHLGSLTDLGFAYFLIEIIVVLLIAAYEIKLSITLSKMNSI
jgi:hypothetical protein